MMAKILENRSDGMKQIMKILGLDGKDVAAFTLEVSADTIPTLTVTHYPDDNPIDGPVTQRFELKLIKEKM